MAFMTLKDIDVCYDKKKQVLKGIESGGRGGASWYLS